MSCDEGETGVEIAMGDGNSRVGGRGDRCGDSRDDFEGDTRREQCFALFTPAAEDERIAAFQSHDPFARTSVLDQQRIDLILRERVGCRAFSHIDVLGIRRVRQQPRIGERVVDHHLRLFQ
jgi:ribosomal protein S18 acetylase RimI-like enzyme